MNSINESTALLVIDIQERLVPAIHENTSMLLNAHKCIKAAKLIEIPIAYTEQYPKGLGSTLTELKSDLENAPVFEKTSFSCCASEGLLEFFREKKIKRVLLVGIEAHVCVYQTAKDLLNLGFEVMIAADAVSSRKEVDRDWALSNLQRAGVFISTFECLFMEYLKGSKHSMFKDVSSILKL